MALKARNGIDLASTGQITNLPDPTVAQNAATKNYVDTTTAATQYGGWGDGDFNLYGDYLSTMSRNSLCATPNFKTFIANAQYVYFMYCTKAFTSTGVRYLTSPTSATSGNTVTVSLYVGTSTASMALLKTVSAPFTTTSTCVSVPWGSAQTVPVGWVAIVFTTSAVGSPGPEIATPNSAAVPAGFLNPSVSQPYVADRVATTLSNPMSFQTGFTLETLPAWTSLY